MERNQTTVVEFVILGVSEDPRVQLPLFIALLFIYLITLLGNTSIITLVYFDCHLHTPMYVFLCNLSFLDMCYTSVTVPKLMKIHFTQHRTILFAECMAQQYFFGSFVIAEYYILSFMALDRYLAICRPLHYTIIMTRRVCFLLSSISWTASFLSSVPISVLTSVLSFCGSNVINHLMCDVKPFIKLSCSDTHILEIVVFFVTTIQVICPFILVCTSYVFIISAILKIRSHEGRKRAFSTCSAHLIIFSLFSGIMICTYAGPATVASQEKDKVLAVLYTAVFPMLNPIIYSLRNREVKSALMRIITRVMPNVHNKCCMCICPTIKGVL